MAQNLQNNSKPGRCIVFVFLRVALDAADAKTLVAHHRAGVHGLWILEQLRLAEVPAGLWHLIAFPLPLAGYDASPVRAVLIGPPGR